MRRNPLVFALLLSTTGCLIDEATYAARREALTDGDGDGFAKEDECDDEDATVNPDAPEACDGRDQDCDGEVDEDSPDAATWYADRDGDGWGAAADALQACDAPAGYTGDATDCDDTDGATHPDAEDAPYDGIDQDCAGGDADDLDADGHAAVEAGGDDCDDTDPTVFPDAEEAWLDGLSDNDCDGEVEALTLEFGATPFYVDRPDAELGRRVEALGDLDGDGKDEFFSAAVYDPTGGTMGGTAWLLSGSGGGEVSSSPNVVAGGSNWYLGTGLGAGPDVNEDGVMDPLVGATGYANGRGAAFGISGSALLAGGSNLTEAALWTVVGDAENTYAGTVSRRIGDTDGDGLDEVAISAPYAASGGFANAGSVGLFNASALTGSLELGDADVSWHGYYVDATLGQDVFPLGDQDGDGRVDVGIAGGQGVPLAVVPGGGAGGAIDGAALTLITDDVSFGSAQPIGDVDGDGRVDVIVSVPESDAFLFTDLTGTRTRGLPDAYCRFDAEGATVWAATDLGDRDGDGLDETMLTVLGHEGYGTSWLGLIEGAEWGFHGVLSPATARLSALSIRPASGFGYRVAYVGDLDGDGTDWLALGGFTDNQGGPDAGAVAVVPLPR
jgi:hypothetical protein